MSLPKHFNILMASALSFSIAATPVGFSPAFAQSAPAAEAPGDSGWQKEFELWRTSNAGGKVSDYEGYLKAYPKGKFANVAKKRIEELSASAQATDTADETAAVTQATKNVNDDSKRDLEMWRQVSKTGKLEDYQKYLKEFPKGKFAKVAKTRMENLTASAPAEEAEEDVAANANQDAEPAEDVAGQDQAEAQDNSQQDEAVETAQSNEEPKGADWEQEYALWKAASDGNTVTEYEAYLKAYPDGKFSAIAQARIAQLAAAEQPDPTIAEGDSQDDSNAAKLSKLRKNKNKNNDAADQSDDQAAQQDPENDLSEDPGQEQDMAEQDGMDEQAPAKNKIGGLKTKQNQNAQDQQQAEYTEGTEESEDASLDKETRRELQGRLSSLGYDTLGADGVFGDRSRDAIASWQQDNGAPVTGYLSDDQVEAIFVASAATYATWLASRVPVRVHRVRPRTEWVVVRPRSKIVVVKRRPAAVVVVKPFRNRIKFKNRVNFKIKLGGCRKKRRC